jgi:hypothetical protein
MKYFLCFLLIFLGYTATAFAQTTSLKINLLKIDEVNATERQALYGYEISPFTNGTYEIKVYKNGGFVQKITTRLAKGSITIKNLSTTDSGAKLTFQLLKANKEVTKTDVIFNPSSTATKASSGFTFKGTLFGDVTAGEYVRRLYLWAVGIAILGASIGIMYAGYRYAMGRGNPTEISSAKEIIVNSLVGLALLLLSFTILRFLGITVVP